MDSLWIFMDLPQGWHGKRGERDLALCIEKIQGEPEEVS